jgi:hypothetical protein
MIRGALTKDIGRGVSYLVELRPARLHPFASAGMPTRGRALFATVVEELLSRAYSVGLPCYVLSIHGGLVAVSRLALP